MKTQKLLLKTAYCFAGLLILASIGLNIYQYQQIRKLSEKPVPEKIVKNESISDSKPVSFKIVQKSEMKSTVPVSKEKKYDISEINELEYQLNAAEEELDMVHEEFADELSKKSEFIHARDQYVKNMLSNPAFTKRKRDILSTTLGDDFDPLYKKLHISKEEFDEFKGMLVDQMMEMESITGASIIGSSSDEEKAEAIRQAREIREKHEIKISDFLGEENKEIYQSYMISLPDRNSLNEFMETLSPDNRINEEQAESMIDSMYEARNEAYAEMGPDRNIGPSSELTEEKLAYMMERSARINEKYIEVSRDMMTPEQIEQYEIFLNQKLDREESIRKMSLYLHDL